jgi:flagellar biosynthetic protein FliP
MNYLSRKADRGWPFWLALVLLMLLLCCAANAALANVPASTSPLLELRLAAGPGKTGTADLSLPVRIMLLLSVLSLAPAILVTMTAFTRIVIVLSMLRHALGMPETPPNQVLVSLALFLALFAMMPVLSGMHELAWQPWSEGRLDTLRALDVAADQMRDYMVRQTRESDLALMSELARTAPPKDVQSISLVQLVPAFMLSELRSAFQIGFMIFLPFIMIDLVVSSILMSLGMMMVPPAMISLPIKVLTFILIDGWNLVARSLLGSFH